MADSEKGDDGNSEEAPFGLRTRPPVIIEIEDEGAPSPPHQDVAMAMLEYHEKKLGSKHREDRRRQ